MFEVEVQPTKAKLGLTFPEGQGKSPFWPSTEAVPIPTEVSSRRMAHSVRVLPLNEFNQANFQ